MRILHYSLGFPPYRSGGLTKFCMDLMKKQAATGNQVGLVWPGQIGWIHKKTYIKDRGVILHENYFIHSYEVINPLPVSLDEGIRQFESFMKDCDREIYSNFFNNCNPEVIHVHTLMGFHKSFLEVAKEKGIRLVFTTHDFFPICPKVTMFRDGDICRTAESCRECGICNITALNIKTIQILQSPVYRKWKDFFIIKKLRKQHRDRYLSENIPNDCGIPVGDAIDFIKLRSYYESMLRLMDIVHYNSTIAKNIYERFFEPFNYQVIGITHGNINDHRRIKEFCDETIRIRYLGPCGSAKGFFYLKKTLDRLWDERKDFYLDVPFLPPETSPYIHSHGKYGYSELESIFDNSDVLIVPSVWYETFGYTVLEALSYGVPVILTNRVGAKDILADGVGIVIHDTNSDELYEVLKDLTAETLRKMNKKIVENQKILTLEEMAKQMERQCYRHG